MIGDHIVVISEFLMADGAFSALLDDLAIQELSHLCG